MDVDFSKRLCDATLGEYIAAERTVGILSGWAIAIFTGVTLVVGRWIWRRLSRGRRRGEGGS